MPNRVISGKFPLINIFSSQTWKKSYRDAKHTAGEINAPSIGVGISET